MTLGVLLERGAAWALALGAAWALLIVTVAVVEAATHGRVRVPCPCPSATRRVLVAAIGLALAGAVPAGAAPRPGPWQPSSEPAVAAPLVGLPVPARPVGIRRPPADRVVAVRPGDSLWAIAEAALPPRAGEPRTARLVTRLHALNRAVVGPDPDHISPGQRLRLPHPLEERDR